MNKKTNAPQDFIYYIPYLVTQSNAYKYKYLLFDKKNKKINNINKMLLKKVRENKKFPAIKAGSFLFLYIVNLSGYRHL